MSIWRIVYTPRILVQRPCQCDILAANPMKKALTCVALVVGVCTVFSQTQPQTANPDIYYHLGPDSVAQEGVPKGEMRGPFTLPSEAYPGTQHTYWVYVPAQYNPKVPASLMIFQDG